MTCHSEEPSLIAVMISGMLLRGTRNRLRASQGLDPAANTERRFTASKLVPDQARLLKSYKAAEQFPHRSAHQGSPGFGTADRAGWSFDSRKHIERSKHTFANPNHNLAAPDTFHLHSYFLRYRLNW